MKHPFEGSMGAEHGPVPNLGRFVETSSLSPAAKDRLLGFQLEQALGRDGVATAAKQAAEVTTSNTER